MVFLNGDNEGKHKIPYRAVVKNEPIFSFAGLWEQLYIRMELSFIPLQS